MVEEQRLDIVGLLGFICSMITRAQPPCRVLPRITTRMVLLIILGSRRQRKVHEMGNRSSPLPATGRLHSRLCSVSCQSSLRRETERKVGLGIRIQQQHPHPQAEVAVGPYVVFEATGCSLQPKMLNETCSLRQSLLSFRHVFAYGCQLQKRSCSGIVGEKWFGMEGTRFWKWPKRAQGLST